MSCDDRVELESKYERLSLPEYRRKFDKFRRPDHDHWISRFKALQQNSKGILVQRNPLNPSSIEIQEWILLPSCLIRLKAIQQQVYEYGVISRLYSAATALLWQGFEIISLGQQRFLVWGSVFIVSEIRPRNLPNSRARESLEIISKRSSITFFSITWTHRVPLRGLE